MIMMFRSALMWMDLLMDLLMDMLMDMLMGALMDMLIGELMDLLMDLLIGALMGVLIGDFNEDLLERISHIIANITTNNIILKHNPKKNNNTYHGLIYTICDIVFMILCLWYAI